MGQAHLIAKSIKDRVAKSPALNASVPGGLHYGVRADTTTLRPFGSLNVEEKGRQYDSGGGAAVEYEATLTIYGNQKVGKVGDIIDLFAIAFNTSTNLPSVKGSVRPIMPIDSTIGEDPDTIFGADVIVGTITWRIIIDQAGVFL